MDHRVFLSANYTAPASTYSYIQKCRTAAYK